MYAMNKKKKIANAILQCFVSMAISIRCRVEERQDEFVIVSEIVFFKNAQGVLQSHVVRALVKEIQAVSPANHRCGALKP